MNGNFVALMSTNEVYRDLDNTRCLTLDLEAIEQDIAELQENIPGEGEFAAADHNHEGVYSPANHTHTGFAAEGHNHDGSYAPANHTHPDTVATAPLWTGAKYVIGTTNINLSKPLSECKNGVILLWSHFNVEANAPVDADFCTTVIPKKKFNGSAWNGESYIAHVPAAMTNDAEVTVCKRLYIYDNKIVGHAANEVYPRNDVVLRAVYEF